MRVKNSIASIGRSTELRAIEIIRLFYKCVDAAGVCWPNKVTTAVKIYARHIQLYEPYVLRHDVPPAAHWLGCCSSGSEHSSTSTHVRQSSSSLRPSGHTQKADPTVLMHWCEHPADPSRHSSTSSQVCPFSASFVPGIP